MTEGELLELSQMATENILNVLSVSFGVIFAYMGGLYFFLRHAPFALRFIAFTLLSVALAFIGVVAFGVHGMLAGMDSAWRTLPENVTGIQSFGGERPAALGGFSIYEAGVMLGFSVFGLVYLALAYVTFAFRWPDNQTRV